jgi:hypothetical protein
MHGNFMPIGLAGLTFLALIITGIIREKSEYIFRLLNNLCAGVCIGMALVSLPVQASNTFSSFDIIGLIGSATLISMVALEHISAAGGHYFLSSYSYEAVNLVDFDDQEDTAIQMSPLTSSKHEEDDFLCEDTEGDEEASNKSAPAGMPSKGEVGMISNRHQEMKRFFPSAILVITSLFSMSSGLVIAAREHLGNGAYIQLFIHTVLIAFTLGTVLEFLNAPKSFFFIFVGIFTASCPLGIIIGCALDSLYFNEPLYIELVMKTSDFAAAVMAGVFLYIASIHIIPAELSAADSKLSVWKAVMKVIAMLVGFLCTALPSLLEKK